jgi:hypothetical protein
MRKVCPSRSLVDATIWSSSHRRSRTRLEVHNTHVRWMPIREDLTDKSSVQLATDDVRTGLGRSSGKASIRDVRPFKQNFIYCVLMREF